jgi:glycosyltransferase involved in cell wall biosynthesis
MSAAALPLISVVTPVYCCANCLRDLCARIGATVGTITEDYEIVLVDDASPDAAWPAIHDLCAHDARIKGIALSRNFGQHYAIAAGLEQVTGEWIVVMDCDLQDRPEEIAQLYAKAKEGYDVVLADREVRQDSWVKRTSSRLFIGMLNYLSGANYDYRTANFSISHRRVVDAIRSMGDASRFFPVMVRWTGFRRTSIAVQHDARADGSSGYTWRKLLRLGLDIVLSNSDNPLRLVAVTGILIALVVILVP